MTRLLLVLAMAFVALASQPAWASRWSDFGKGLEPAELTPIDGIYFDVEVKSASSWSCREPLARAGDLEGDFEWPLRRAMLDSRWNLGEKRGFVTASIEVQVACDKRRLTEIKAVTLVINAARVGPGGGMRSPEVIHRANIYILDRDPNAFPETMLRTYATLTSLLPNLLQRFDAELADPTAAEQAADAIRPWTRFNELVQVEPMPFLERIPTGIVVRSNHPMSCRGSTDALGELTTTFARPMNRALAAAGAPQAGDQGFITGFLTLRARCDGDFPRSVQSLRLEIHAAANGETSNRREATRVVSEDIVKDYPLDRVPEAMARALARFVEHLPRVMAELAGAQSEGPQLQGSLARVSAPTSHGSLPQLSEPHRVQARTAGDAAVIVGFERYAFLPDVPYAARDAQVMRDLMVHTLGVPSERVHLLTEGTAEHIRRSVERAAAEAKGGRVWIYFAGHGAAEPTSGARLLLGDDTRADPLVFGSRGVRVADLERVAMQRGAEPVLILDTCYAGAGRSGDAIVAGTRFVVPQYALASTGAHQWVAAGPDQLSGPLDEVQHGAFTYFVTGALRGWADGELDGVRDGVVTAAEATAYVRRALAARQIRSQTPQWLGAPDLVLASGVSEEGPEL